MERYLVVGKITGTQGIRGEVRVYPYTESPERFDELEHVFLDRSLTKKLVIETSRGKKNMAVLKFEGINSVEEAEKLKDMELLIDRETQGRELDEDEHYIVDLIGKKVIDAVHGLLGTLEDVLTHTGQDLYVVKLNSTGKQLLIPGVKPFVEHVDLEAGEIHVRLIEGMLE